MKSGSDRTKAWRKRLVEEGYRQKTFFLSPTALKGLARLAATQGVSETEAIEQMLTDKGKLASQSKMR